MPSALFNGQVIADSPTFVEVEGNVYFPRSAVRTDVLTPSDTTSVCPWKGTARYHTVSVDGVESRDAAWYYPDPKPEAAEIRDHIAFWRGVEIRR